MLFYKDIKLLYWKIRKNIINYNLYKKSIFFAAFSSITHYSDQQEKNRSLRPIDVLLFSDCVDWMCLCVHCAAVDTELECLAKAWIWSCYPSTTRKPSSRKRGLCSGPIFCQSHSLPSLVSYQSLRWSVILNSDPHSTIVFSDAALSC